MKKINKKIKKRSLEDFIPLTASILFLSIGISFMTSRTTGFFVIEDISVYQTGLLGIASFILSLSLLLFFLRSERIKRGKK